MTETFASIIVTYNRKDLLVACLKANLAQSRRLDKIIVVDNASTDGTADTLQASGLLADERVEYLRLDTNCGRAGGFAKGMAHAVAQGLDWFWLMDDDAEPAPDSLEKLIEGSYALPTDADRDRCVFVSRVTTPAGTIDSHHRRHWSIVSLGSRRLDDEEYHSPRTEIGVASFVGFLVGRASVEAVGYPRSEFFIYYDDTEYSLRRRKGGGSIFLIRDSRIAHPENPGDTRYSVKSPAFVWRNFYHLRNKAFTYRLYAPSRLALLYGLAKAVVAMQWSVLAFEPYKWRRSQLFHRAILAGWRGDLGKTLDPATF